MGFCTEMIWITPWYECFLLFQPFLVDCSCVSEGFSENRYYKIILSSQFSCLKMNMKPAFGGKKTQKKKGKKRCK